MTEVLSEQELRAIEREDNRRLIELGATNLRMNDQAAASAPEAILKAAAAARTAEDRQTDARHRVNALERQLNAQIRLDDKAAVDAVREGKRHPGDSKMTAQLRKDLEAAKRESGALDELVKVENVTLREAIDAHRDEWVAKLEAAAVLADKRYREAAEIILEAANDSEGCRLAIKALTSSTGQRVRSLPSFGKPNPRVAISFTQEVGAKELFAFLAERGPNPLTQGENFAVVTGKVNEQRRY